MSRILRDLIGCYQVLVPGEKVVLPPQFTIDKKVDRVMRLIRMEIPKAFSINIEQEKGAYKIAVYAGCPYKNYLPSFMAGPTLLKLKTEYPALHDVFVEFLKTFIRKTCVDTWWDDIFSMSVESLDDNLTEFDPEFTEEAEAEIKVYREGDAARYEKLLRLPKKTKGTAAILSSLNRLRKKHPVIKVIQQGCTLIDMDMNMFKFKYQPEGKEDESGWDIEPLRFENQAMIFFNDGHCASEYDTWIECQSGEGGIDVPVYAEFIKPGQKTAFNADRFKEKCLWPLKLANFITDTSTVLNKYAKK